MSQENHYPNITAGGLKKEEQLIAINQTFLLQWANIDFGFHFIGSNPFKGLNVTLFLKFSQVLNDIYNSYTYYNLCKAESHFSLLSYYRNRESVEELILVVDTG